jgi:hypothetical protein
MAFSNQPKDGGYCSMCDTVWVSPGKCRCESVYEKLTKNNVDSEEYLDGWNAAIEAAAKLAEMKGQYLDSFNVAIEIRKLKK